MHGLSLTSRTPPACVSRNQVYLVVAQEGCGRFPGTVSFVEPLARGGRAALLASPEQKRAALYKPSFHRFGTASRVQVFVQRSLRALPFAVTAELYYAMAMNHIIAQGMSLARFI